MKTIYQTKNHRKFDFNAYIILVTKYRKNKRFFKIKNNRN